MTNHIYFILFNIQITNTSVPRGSESTASLKLPVKVAILDVPAVIDFNLANVTSLERKVQKERLTTAGML